MKKIKSNLYKISQIKIRKDLRNLCNLWLTLVRLLGNRNSYTVNIKAIPYLIPGCFLVLSKPLFYTLLTKRFNGPMYEVSVYATFLNRNNITVSAYHAGLSLIIKIIIITKFHFRISNS